MSKILDPLRPTVGVSNKDGDVNTITDLIVWSHTFGWKQGMPEDITIWQRQLHADPVWSRVRSAVSYRMPGDIYQYTERLRKPDAYGSFMPENWQAHVHEVHLAALDGDKAFWAIFAGDMFDYGSVRCQSGVNATGVVSFDRLERKDAYWLYKANWNSAAPFIHIAGGRHPQRRDAVQTIKIYSNIEKVELWVNGESLGTRTGRTGIFTWEGVKLIEGANTVVAQSPIATEEADGYVLPGVHIVTEATITFAPGGKLYL